MTLHAKLFLEHDKTNKGRPIPVIVNGNFAELWQIKAEMDSWKDKCMKNSVGISQ